MSDVVVQSRTQKIVVASLQKIIVNDRAVNVVRSPNGVRVISAGPQGPPGVQGLQGLPGESADVVVEAMMIAHIESPTPHPAYDDMIDLTTHLENGLY